MTVYGEGKDAVLFDVSCEILDSPPPGATAQLIKNLEREREVLQGEKTLISNAASNVLIKFGYSLNAENNTVTNVENFLDSLLERGPQMLERARDIDDHIDELDKKIAQQRKTLKKEKARASTDACVTAVIMAKQAGRVAITLTYSKHVDHLDVYTCFYNCMKCSGEQCDMVIYLRPACGVGRRTSSSHC